MTFHKNTKTNSYHYFYKSGAFIALLSVCAAFFITPQISADNVPTTTSGPDIMEESKSLKISPTEISTEEAEVIEEASTEKEPPQTTKPEEKEVKIIIDERENSEKTSEEKIMPEAPTEISTEEVEILPDEKPQDSEFVDDIVMINENSAPIQKESIADATEKSTIDTTPQLPQDIPKENVPPTEEEAATSVDKPADITIDGAKGTSQENAAAEKDSSAADIVISEVSIDETNDWIELYNQTDVPIDLAAQKYRIERATKSGGDPKYYLGIGNTSHGIFPHGTIIAGHGYYLITDENAPNEVINIADAIIHKKRGFTLTKDNTIYLSTGSVGKPSNEHHEDDDIIDYVGYGKAIQFEGQPTNNPPTGKSLMRKGAGSLLIDTDSNSDDFAITNKPTPTNSRGESGNDIDEDTSIIDYKKLGARLNEIFPNPQGNDKKGYEFVEIINTGTKPINLSKWEIETTSKNGVIKRKKLKELSKGSSQILPENVIDFPLSLTNSFFIIRLYAPNGDLITETNYRDAKEGRSWNYHKNGWYWAGPTPGGENQENPQTKEYPHIRINEILPDPRASEQEHEFIELYNPTNESIRLRDWIIKDATKTGQYSFTNEIIPPKGYFLLYRSTFGFALNNASKESLLLIAPNGKTISTISYARAREGQSLNYHTSQWYWTQKTPGKLNAKNPLTKKYPAIIINEALPNPTGDENTDEYIELYNPNDHTVDLDGWALSDSSKTGLYVLPQSTKIYARSFIVIYRKDFSFALNNSGGETISLLAPNTKVKSFVSYKSAREGISYNFTGQQWRWSKHLSPGRGNVFNNLPEVTSFSIDKKAYRDVYVNFHIKAKDRDHEKMKVRWDFGDERKSYLWETRHKYKKTGTYDASVRIQDGSEEITKEFRVVVKKYPHRKVSITAILPNPAGKDADGEYVIIENESKKKIKLRGWSIATGSTKDKLVNHPIREKLTARAQASQKITREHAALTLPNKVGVVELRRPDGSTADTVSYEHEKSIKDNVLFMKIDGVWTWVEPFLAISRGTQLISVNTTNQIIATAFANESKFSQQHGTILGAQTDQDITRSLHISSVRTLFEKILNILTTFLHKALLLLS